MWLSGLWGTVENGNDRCLCVWLCFLWDHGAVNDAAPGKVPLSRSLFSGRDRKAEQKKSERRVKKSREKY